MVPTIKPPPPVEDSHVSDSLWTLTETETDSVSSPCPVRGIQPTLPMPKVILYSNRPPVKSLPWTAPPLAAENSDAAPTPTPPLEDIILRQMVPMVKPPPLVEGSNVPNTKTLSLDDTVHALRDLLFTITLPKTEKAKTAAITVKALHHVHQLSGSTCSLLQEHHNGPRLDDISRQIDNIKTLLVTPSSTRSPQKMSYAATLAMGTKSPAPPAPPQPLPARRHDVTLTQKSRKNPVLANLTNNELISKITATLWDADVGLPT